MGVQDRFGTYVSDQREFFDALITEDWDTYKSDEWDRSRRFEVARLFAVAQPATILDIGCGCGFHDVAMAEYLFVQKIDAIDYSAKSIEQANAHYPHDKVRRSVVDIRSDSVPEQYDMVVSYQVFEHLDVPDDYMNFAVKACKPGGFIAIFTPNRVRLSNRLRKLKGLAPQYCDPQHFYEYDLGELKRFGTSRGLTVKLASAYGLAGHPRLDRMPLERRLKLGMLFPFMASSLYAVFQKPY